MSAPSIETVTIPRFRQPRPCLRWIAVILAAAGWYVSLQMLLVSAGSAASDPFMRAVCGGTGSAEHPNDCKSVLTAPQAYWRIPGTPDVLRIPVSACGMLYFATVGLWYFLIGPPARTGRRWHWLLLAIVLAGAACSLNQIRIMHFELQRWCLGCVAAHAVNGALLVLTLWVYPWRATGEPGPAHPSRRLVLATVVAALLLLATHVASVAAIVANSFAQQRSTKYQALVSDPDFIRWDYQRQPVVHVPSADDETFAGDPNAPFTAVVFADFQCRHCRELDLVLQQALAKHAGRLRLVYRHYPDDPACNPHARGGITLNASACRAARAVEAARLLGGADKYFALRRLIWERQDALPNVPYEQQSPAQRNCFATWAVEVGLDRAAFEASLVSPAVDARLQADVALARELNVTEVPTVFLNGKRLRDASRIEAWDALLSVAP